MCHCVHVYLLSYMFDVAGMCSLCVIPERLTARSTDVSLRKVDVGPE